MGKPDQRRGKHQTGGNAVENTFQRQRVAEREIGENGHPLVVEGGIDQRGQNDQRESVFHTEKRALFSLALHTVYDAAGEGDKLEYRMAQTHGESEDKDKIQQIHRRVNANKFICPLRC